MSMPRAGKFGRKLSSELKKFAIISAYLYIFFGAVILYTVSALQKHGIPYEPYGFAFVNSLLIAKFILIGDSLDIAKTLVGKPMIYSVFYKSAIYLIFVIILSGIEKVTTGLIHGRPAIEALSEIGGRTPLQILASCMLLWLILLPIVGIQQLGIVLGKDALYRLFFVAN